MFTQGVPPPFSFSTSVPRSILQLSDGQKHLSTFNLNDSLLMIESDSVGYDVDEFLDLIEFSKVLIVIYRYM